MDMITYADKVALNENPEIQEINKITAENMNEIKTVVNNFINDVISNRINKISQQMGTLLNVDIK